MKSQELLYFPAPVISSKKKFKVAPHPSVEWTSLGSYGDSYFFRELVDIRIGDDNEPESFVTKYGVEGLVRFNEKAFDVPYSASLKHVHFRLPGEAQVPSTIINFDPSGSSNYTGVQFLDSGWTVTNTSEYPGHINLQTYSSRDFVGHWLGSGYLEFDNPVTVESIDVTSANYNNLGLDVFGQDSNDVEVGRVTTTLDVSTPQTLQLGFDGVKKLQVRHNSSGRQQDPSAVGDVMIIGGRPVTIIKTSVGIVNIVVS